MKKLIALSLLIFLLCISSFFFFVRVPDLVVVGPVSMADGLGRQSVELVDALKEDVSFLLIPTDRNLKDVPKHIKVENKNRTFHGKVIVCQEPLEAPIRKLDPALRSQELRIAYSMVEGTLIPQEKVDLLNRNFDAVVVPDRFLLDVYQKSGVTIPLFVLPLGRNFQPFLEVPLKTERGIPFTFATLGSGHRRKNLPMLIRAFRKAFGNRSDVRLVLNCRVGTDHHIFEELASTNSPNITLTTKALGNSEYLDLFRQVDCYVNVSKAEGFSIQPREAMAMGIPTIVTDNSAQHTISETGLVRTIPCPKREMAFSEYFPQIPIGLYFSCEEDSIVEALLDVERNYDTYLEKAALAREWAAQYDFSRLKPLYKTLVKPDKIVLGTENRITEDCLITNSEELFLKYRAVLKAH